MGAPHAGLLRFLFLMNLFLVKKRARPRTAMIATTAMPTIAPEGISFLDGPIVVLLPVVVVGSEVETGSDEVEEECDADWEAAV
jgi:hypothetical protein